MDVAQLSCLQPTHKRVSGVCVGALEEGKPSPVASTSFNHWIIVDLDPGRSLVDLVRSRLVLYF